MSAGDQGRGAQGAFPGEAPDGTSAAPSGGPAPQVLFALAAAGALAFNFPLLMVWDTGATVLGLPLLPVALFAIWAGLIAALAFVSERRGRSRNLLAAPAPFSGPGPEERP